MMSMLIRAGIVITGIEDGEVLHNQGVVINGDRIERIDHWEAFSTDEAANVVDASRQVLMPGLIDAHIHITATGDPQDRFEFLPITEDPAKTALKSTRHALRHLQMGVTTVRVLGTTDWVDIALRDAIAAGWFPGPRMLVAGRGITCSLGHMDRHRALRYGIVAEGMGNGAVADTPDEARRATWENLMHGADVIKINATTSDYVPKTDSIICYPELTFEAMKAVCDVAHGADRLVAAHCHGGSGIDLALDAGVDTFEHGRFLTDPQLERMAELGRFLVPTLSPEARQVEAILRGEPYTGSSSSARWMEIATERMYDTVERAHRCGVRVAAGSDVAMPNVRHGEVAYEMFHLAKAGLSNATTIASATRIAAESLDLGDSLGQVRTGYIADLVLVDGDPLQDIALLMNEQNIRCVIQSGKVVIDRDLANTSRMLTPDTL